MRLHFINDSSIERTKTQLGRKRFPWSGRIFGYDKKYNDAFNIEWSLGGKSCHVSVTRKENKLAYSIAVPLVALWLVIRTKTFKSFHDNWELGLSIHSGSLWWDVFSDPNGWSSDMPRWRDGNIGFLDTILGRSKYLSETLDERDVLIPMPEKAYKAHAKLHVDSWKRPWGFARRLKRITIDVEEGVPHEGKGENDYDCGPDATYSMTCPADSIPHGVGEFVGSQLATRIRYGGWDDWEWKKDDALLRDAG